MLESKKSHLNGIGIGDQRTSGALTQSQGVVFATAAFSMDINDLVVRLTTDNVLGFTVTLPSVKEAKGRIYSITLVTDGGTNATIEDKVGDAGFSDVAFSDANDYVLLYSDGYKWHTLLSEVA